MNLSRDFGMAAHRETGISLTLAALALFLGTYYASEIGLTQNRVFALWPAAGISLWMCWRHGVWGAVVTFITLCLYNLVDESEPAVNASNALAAWVSARLIRTKCDFELDSAAHNMTWVMVAGVLLSFLSAAFGGPFITHKFDLSFTAGVGVTMRWFMADVAGILLFAPVMFIASLQSRKLRLVDFIGIELVLAMFCSLLLTLVMFFVPWSISLSVKALVITSPFIFFFITRKHTLRVFTACSVIGFCALSVVAVQLNNDNVTLLETQLFLLTFLTCAMFIHLMLVEVTKARDLFELRVSERTEELASAMVAAKAADDSKSKFLANTSHELRTPLNGILGMARTLGKQDLGADNNHRVQTIIASGQSLLGLLNDVIDLSKIEAHQLEVSPVPTNLKALLEETEDLWAEVARQNDIQFSLNNYAESSDWYLVDPQRLKQCINNLISNAVKFSKGKSVFVAVREREDGGLEFEVRDTGIGIKAESVERLFLPFEQLDASIGRQFGGTGLGLNITKQLIELMAGEICVVSEYGEGSTFRFWIPSAITEPEADEDEFEVNLSRLKGVRTLLVEDNEINRMVVTDLLEDMQIDEAEHGLEALAKLSSHEYDLVLLDIQMPVMDGIETIKTIRSSSESWAEIPVIALTANAMSEDRAELLGLGMSGYASKPVDPPVLIKEMLQAVGRKSS